MESVIARTVHFWLLSFGPFNWAKVGPGVSLHRPWPSCVSRVFSLKIDINGHFD